MKNARPLTQPVIPLLILAAGGSTRMGGRDKLMEDVDGQPLLRLQATRALATGQPVYVALPALGHPRSRALAGTDAKILAVPQASSGLSATMRGAVRQLPADLDVMILLADLVALETGDLQSVLAGRLADPDALIWRGATQSGKAGHPVIFHKSLRPCFDHLSGDTGAAPLIDRFHHRTRLVPLPGHRARLDLDTPQDWQDWRAERQ